MPETIFVDQQAHEIEVKKLTLIFNEKAAIYYPDRVMIDPEMTLQKFKELTELNVFQIELFKLVAPDVTPVALLNLRAGHIGFQHLMGLISCSLELMLLKKQFGWRWPETYLHPKYHGNLADLMLLLSSPEEFISFIRRCQELHKA